MTRVLALAGLLVLAASPATAGETACWFENGVVVVPAQVLGVTGDFILDTATAHTQLAETQAQTAGFDETALTGDLRLAGVSLTGATVAVADLDMRTGALPTPVAGVIGADVLRPYVVDISFAPCRVRLSLPRRAPGFRASTRMKLTWVADRPTVTAQVSDGARILTGGFSPGVGVDRAVRISDAAAQAPGADKPRELYPFGILEPRVQALKFAGDVAWNLPGGLLAAEDPGLAGEIGGPYLQRYRLRFDFPAGRLLIAPAR
jgi:hypothetical protein